MAKSTRRLSGGFTQEIYADFVALDAALFLATENLDTYGIVCARTQLTPGLVNYGLSHNDGRDMGRVRVSKLRASRTDILHIAPPSDSAGIYYTNWADLCSLSFDPPAKSANRENDNQARDLYNIARETIEFHLNDALHAIGDANSLPIPPGKNMELREKIRRLHLANVPRLEIAAAVRRTDPQVKTQLEWLRDNGLLYCHFAPRVTTRLRPNPPGVCSQSHQA